MSEANGLNRLLGICLVFSTGSKPTDKQKGLNCNRNKSS
ncbi:protein of unknown function [Ectopseudomonas oleovorans]|nr:protein of unknown function [Pseudomonas oleovorans]